MDTSYDTLLQAFPTLYQELNNIKGTDMLNTGRQSFNFVENNIFKKSLPKECILHSINSCMCEYKREVLNILNVLLPMLAEGFSIQCGALFGFGLKANESTGTLLKLSTASAAVKEKLNQAPIHNLNEKRSVGFITREVNIRGTDQLEPASKKKMILNKSINLLEKSLHKPKKFLSFEKASESINEIKLKWTEKLKKHQADGYSKQECLNLRKESERLEIREFLKSQALAGRFTKPAEVKSFMKSNKTLQEKQRRMKKEVKYARMSCTTMKESDALFRFKKNHADLNNVLHGLTMTLLFKNDIENTNGFVVGEYIAAVWFEDTTYKWYLGVIEHINPNNAIVVSYLIWADTKGKTWVFPDEAQLVETEAKQILMRNIHVRYMQSGRINCKVESDLNISELDNAIEQLKKQSRLLNLY